MGFKFKSVKNQFKKVKEQMEEEKNNRSGGGPDWLFKPRMVQGEEETTFKIRFLPIPESTTGKPWVEIRYHMFEREGDNLYVKAIDPKSIDPTAENPITDLVRKLYQSDNQMDQDQAATMRSKSRFFTLVYIKEAPEGQKELEGKVLVFEAGVQVFRKMEAAINKQDICFWDPYEGTDFILSIKETGNAKRKWPSYLESEFARRDGPITDEDDEMSKIETEIGKFNIKELVVEKDGLKTGEELREMMEGGLTGGNGGKKNTKPTKDLTKESNDDVDDVDNDDEPDFGDIDEEDLDTNKEKKSSKDAKKVEEEDEEDSGEVGADLDELDVDFSDDDFSLDD